MLETDQAGHNFAKCRKQADRGKGFQRKSAPHGLPGENVEGQVDRKQDEAERPMTEVMDDEGKAGGAAGEHPRFAKEGNRQREEQATGDDGLHIFRYGMGCYDEF